MASYDSDSSFEDEDFTETNVLLGYASKEPTGDEISQLGGYPAWLDGKTAPSGALAKCKVCNSFMSLLLQLNGDLPSRFPEHERRLYLFTCRRKACRRKEGSIRGIRGNRVTKSKEPTTSKPQVEQKTEPKPEVNIGAALFGVSSPSPSTSSNPFSSPNTSSTSANPFATASSLTAKAPQKPADPTSTLSETFASKARISSPPTPSDTTKPPPLPNEPWPLQSSSPPAYPKYHLDAEYESLDAPRRPPIPAQARQDSEAEPSEPSGGGEDRQLLESSMDAAFQRFADRLAQNAEQVLRYEVGGAPLLYCWTDAVGGVLGSRVRSGGGVGGGMPRCGNCGAERVFEVQLVPHAIAVLEEEEDVGLEGMDWGTVILGVCGRDCAPAGTAEGEVGYAEEWVGVQWEELAKRGA